MKIDSEALALPSTSERRTASLEQPSAWGGDVTRNGNPGRKARHASARRRIPTARLDAMIEEAIVDAYTESEQAVGFHATVEQHLQLPFETLVLGVAVTDSMLRGWTIGSPDAVRAWAAFALLLGGFIVYATFPKASPPGSGPIGAAPID